MRFGGIESVARDVWLFAATDDNTLDQIQPSRWPPSARSSCTLLNKVKFRLAGGFATTELLPDDDNTFICAHDARRCKWSAQGSTCEPSARLLLSAGKSA